MTGLPGKTYQLTIVLLLTSVGLRTAEDVAFATACAIFLVLSGWRWETDKLDEEKERRSRLRFPLLSRPSTYVVLLSAMLYVSSALEVDAGHSKLLVELGYWGVFGGFVVRYWEYRALKD